MAFLAEVAEAAELAVVRSADLSVALPESYVVQGMQLLLMAMASSNLNLLVGSILVLR